ncbi:putative RNA-binding protein Luc7-like 1 isoform X1 [Maniola hyperantus]|uniref:putative RNA-binding protein Luc7-like 1 isoform X1 n=2 Tax=Aphantopus hyperantus TaxID=2795564 RepID=UPI0015687959|nr:putative RNA-binding protein Luc7-like 1 isoform X1 [Maniola hyperantus]
MSAHEQMRAMLDQLMGTARNGETDKHGVKFYDDTVCKSFLLQCCPHEILSSTRMDLGECPKIHDLALRADFELASKTKDYFYDIDATEHLETFIADCDRRTTAAKQRLAETQEELSAEVTEKANAVHELAEQIGQKLARAEALGEEGMVEDSVKLMGEIDELRKKKAVAEQEYRNSMPASSYQQQKLRVCEVCSAYLGIHDNDRRLADHFGGKLHLGFITIREKLADLKKTVDKRREERGVHERERGGGRRHYVGGRELDRRARRHRETARERDRDRNDRNKERGERDKERTEQRDKERTERDKERADRDKERTEQRDRERSERDKERTERTERDRERTERRRSRSRSRSKRDESREKSRGRDRDREREARRSRSNRSTSRERRRE